MSNDTADKVKVNHFPKTLATYFADNVLRDPVVSINAARNSWYFVQAMVM